MWKSEAVGSAAVIVALLVVAVDIGLARLGYGLLLPAIRHDLGGAYAVYGLIGAVHLGGYLAGTVAAPSLLRDRSRLPRVTASAQLAVAATLALSAAAIDPITLTIARALLGAASGVGIASAITDAFERVAPQRRGAASALAWSGIGAGLIVCAPGGFWALGHSGAWRVAMLLAALPALAVAVLAFRLPVHTARAATSAAKSMTWRLLFARSNVFFVASYGAYGTAYIAYATFAVAAFASRGFAAATIGAVWIAFGTAAILGALAIGRVLAGRAHRWSMVLPLSAGAFGSLVSALPPVACAVVGALCIGIGLAAAPAAASAFARDRSDAASYARAFAGVTTVFGAGQIAGPVFAGAAADAFGLEAVPLLTAAIFAFGTLCAAVDARQALTPAASLG